MIRVTSRKPAINRGRLFHSMIVRNRGRKLFKGHEFCIQYHRVSDSMRQRKGGGGDLD